MQLCGGELFPQFELGQQHDLHLGRDRHLQAAVGAVLADEFQTAPIHVLDRDDVEPTDVAVAARGFGPPPQRFRQGACLWLARAADGD